MRDLRRVQECSWGRIKWINASSALWSASFSWTGTLHNTGSGLLLASHDKWSQLCNLYYVWVMQKLSNNGRLSRFHHDVNTYVSQSKCTEENETHALQKYLLILSCFEAGIKSANSQLNQAFKMVLKFNDSPSVCIEIIRCWNVMRLYSQRSTHCRRCSDYSCRNPCERSPAGYIDLLRSSAERRTAFLMNNT